MQGRSRAKVVEWEPVLASAGTQDADPQPRSPTMRADRANFPLRQWPAIDRIEERTIGRGVWNSGAAVVSGADVPGYRLARLAMCSAPQRPLRIWPA